MPEVGSCASSGRASRLWAALGGSWAAQHSQREAGPLTAQPPPRVLELATSKAADFTAFDPLGTAPPPLVLDALHAALSAPSAARALLRLCWLLAGRAAQSLGVAVGVLAVPRRMLGAAA